MKHIILIFLPFITLTINTYGQEFNKAINKDSLLQTILKDFPEDKRSELFKVYGESDEHTKEFFLLMLSMPRSSKKELIANIDSNFDKIDLLKSAYLKLVPDNYVVYIEFNPGDKVAMTKESIDLTVRHTGGKQNDIQQEWNLEYGSEKLVKMLQPLKWTNDTVLQIKQLLADARCISIENGAITTIGFARSGMGKYYFKLFDSNLTAEQMKEYNDGCEYIFYKKNIVLEYGGGAIGAQCFPD